MTYLIGIDVGGTKISAGLFDQHGELLASEITPSPNEYQEFLDCIQELVQKMEQEAKESCKVGLSMVGAIDRAKGLVRTGNLQCIVSQPVFDDLSTLLKREIRYTNDANASVLAEAISGAGQGKAIVFGFIMGTGIGGGIVINQQIVEGINGLAGEIGQLPMPYYEKDDGAVTKIKFGAPASIESFIQGKALTSLCLRKTGKDLQPPEIADLARAGNREALDVLEHYYELVAKSMAVIIHSIDPDIIVVSGGLNSLPSLYEEVPKRWGKYCVADQIKTKFVPAKHGPMAGMRGAAYLWR